MEENKNLFTVIKSEAEKIKTIIDNTLIMLGNRIYIDKTGAKNRLLDPEIAIKTIKDKGDNTFIIQANNGDNYVLKIVFQKISTSGRQSVISEFFKDYEQYKKILVAKEFNNKISDYVSRNHTQIFNEDTLLSDLIKARFQPKFELLSPTEMEQFKSEYNVTDYTCGKMVRNDAITKYYGLKKGDIIRVIRPSSTSGRGIGYRIVT